MISTSVYRHSHLGGAQWQAGPQLVERSAYELSQQFQAAAAKLMLKANPGWGMRKFGAWNQLMTCNFRRKEKVYVITECF